MSRWDLYGAIRKQLLGAGFGHAQAIEAARIADRALREQRNACIRACRKSGMGIRAISRAWGISVASAHNICGGVFSDEDEIEHPQPTPSPHAE